MYKTFQELAVFPSHSERIVITFVLFSLILVATFGIETGTF